jgi:HD-GYP domain-containing protein (c-di-GMP phosphodiesterase class II)
LVTVTVAGGALVASWGVAFAQHSSALDERTTLLLLSLLAGLILAYHFPIHVDLSSKVYMGSIVLYLMAALLPPAVAATSSAVGILAGELSIRQQTGNLRIPAIIPTQVGRWVIISLVGSVVAHAPANPNVLPLLGASGAMWALDILTGPLLLSPLLGQGPVPVMQMMIREGGVFEAVQYLIGVLGALAATSQIWTLSLLVPPAALVYLAFKNATEVRMQTRRMFQDLADTVDERDPWTHGHSRRVAELARETAQSMGKRGPQLDVIVFAARTHDTGMVGIPGEIARKPAELTEPERALLQAHAERGADLLARYSDLLPCARIVRHHHETWDGTGYPHRLRGADIPFGSRVIAVAESYDAMTSDRPYRPRMSSNRAALILNQGRGSQWDPEVVDAFLSVIKDRIDVSGPASLRLVRNEDTQDIG